MIFGGLELVAGGYLVHRHYKKKDLKKRQEDELEARRQKTFPGVKPAGHRQQQQPMIAAQKFACYGVAQPQPQPQPLPTQQYANTARPVVVQPRPGPPPQYAQTFTIPRRPVPDRKQAQIIIEPSLQRTDSFATLSRMPIANGYHRPQNLPQDAVPILPPRRHVSGGISPATATQTGVYGNAGFSVSTPSFGATRTSPGGLTYTMATADQVHGGYAADDWETHGHAGHRLSHYAPTEASTQLGEHDPPPPYAP
ncbi:hypothetical protein ACEQ8H_003276 [Pleosporales sp. CAS-2024a]